MEQYLLLSLELPMLTPFVTALDSDLWPCRIAVVVCCCRDVTSHVPRSDLELRQRLNVRERSLLGVKSELALLVLLTSFAVSTALA